MRTLLLNLSDKELIEHLQAGNAKAFDILFSRYRKDVRNVIVYYVRDKEVAEDICQDVFIRIYTSLKHERYNEHGSFLPWVLRIARNLCMDHLRKVSRLPAMVNGLADNGWHPIVQNYAEKRMLTKQQQHHMNGLINNLPEDQKKVVYYRYFEDLSFKEISMLMNTSINTSIGRMRYGLERLRKQVNYSALFL